ncbi:hypothetical protein H5410_002379 [Solanum commersonii]|uniref:Uncharacterized protein n=1 Tax=Solanum commersonii TaxID=4109 RepID=A0A9J6B1R4_SOLCO|nr:hypothetical protein H5410_002379 [Solanum commersonii]
MNVHNKTQFTNARINCIPKDSSCDTPLLKILKHAILASNVGSSSTKVFEWPRIKDDSIFTHKVDWINGINSRCYHARFTVSSSHKASTPNSNKTPHFR